MLATVFGWYGAFGTTMLLSAYIFLHHGLVLALLRFGWFAVLGILIVISALTYAYFAYMLSWLTFHVGSVAAYGAGALLALPTLLFLRQTLLYIVKRIRK